MRKKREIFPNPTVKSVIFQITFSDLFYIENNIGALQLKLMNRFPKSSVGVTRRVFLADLAPDSKIEDLVKAAPEYPGDKIWMFKSEDGKIQLQISNKSLSIDSSVHKTYDLSETENFREVIKFVVDQFLSIIHVPVLSRIGLRYIDECPIFSLENKEFKKCFKTSFPLRRFNLPDAVEMDFKTIIKKDPYKLRYIESLQEIENKKVLILDFDAFGENISSDRILSVTDTLHKLIYKEYRDTIDEPILEYMRRGT